MSTERVYCVCSTCVPWQARVRELEKQLDEAQAALELATKHVLVQAVAQQKYAVTMQERLAAVGAS